MRNRVAREALAETGFLYRNRKQVAILLCCAALLLVSQLELVLRGLALVPAPFSLPALVLLFAVFMPLRLVGLSLIPAMTVLLGVYALNAEKVAALGLPIMFFDLKMIASDPTVVINATGADPARIRAAGIVLLLVCSLALLFGILRHSRLPRQRRSSLLLSAICVVAVVATARATLLEHGRYVHANFQEIRPEMWQNLWLPETQVRLSRKMGVPEYVAFTSFAGTSEMHADLSGAQALPPDAAEGAALHLFGTVELPRPAVLPNIVIYHAESTFDPNLAFALSAPVELPLWSALPTTRMLGPLRVNVLGGGSWVTEFEVLTGVDSRIFGYQGFYTHYYLAPSVRSTFAHYLAKRGYRTAVFYSAEGSFYNAERAFRQYGFADFVDSLELGLPAEWTSLRDSTIVRTVVERGVFDEPGPFLYFISSAENHGPHPCGDAPLVATFATPASASATCQLNEYLRRARSTSAAFETILGELQAVEEATGRPFVLLAYGDHQPWSFTDGRYVVAGGTAANRGSASFAGTRLHADLHQTFFHVVSSIEASGEPRFAEPIPVWLLPALLSRFVAASVEDMYSPWTLHAYAECGSDILAASCTTSRSVTAVMRAALFTDPASRRTAPRESVLRRIDE